MTSSKSEGSLAQSNAGDRKAFATLCRETELAEWLFESAGPCLALVDGAGQMTAINAAGRAWLRDAGNDKSSVERWSDVWPAPSRDNAMRAHAGAWGGSSETFYVTFHSYTQTAPEFAVEVKPLNNASGRVAAVLATWPNRAAIEFDDKIKALEAQISSGAGRQIALRNAVAQSERSQALSEFVVTIAHDLNNALTSASSALRIIARSIDSGRNAEIAERGQEKIEKGARLIRQMLDFARGPQDAASTIQISDVIAKLEPNVRSLVGATVHVNFNMANDLWLIHLPGRQLESVILNIAANARETMFAGGTLRVEARNVAPTECPETLTPGEYVRLTFIDSGAGMAPDTLRRAGQIFFTTKKPGRGSGHGLASAFKLAEEAGGGCFVANQPGRDAEVSLYLPRAPIQPGPADASSRS